MSASAARLVLPWSGLIVGALAWYGAHELGFYLLRPNCQHPWIVPVIHLVALLLTVAAGVASLMAEPRRPRSPMAWIGLGGAALFALVIAFQGGAGLVYSGCER
ncbi:hypothetical protein SAMN02990966_06838 [Rhodospirillales bacterium URHD0017]|nr:hypothetical protein SAMN02990966_06838 [Rhodospirillales bacterium URHD0017]